MCHFIFAIKIKTNHITAKLSLNSINAAFKLHFILAFYIAIKITIRSRYSKLSIEQY